MTDSDQDHIVLFEDARPHAAVCGDRPLFTRSPRGVWRSNLTGNPPIQPGEQWDHPAGEICPDCLILTLTLGDDPTELAHWANRSLSSTKAVAIAETAIRDAEIAEQDATDPPPPSAPHPSTPSPARGQRHRHNTPRRPQQRHNNRVQRIPVPA